jgi:hypothetical protein
MPAGKYDCLAIAGSGNFIGTVASLRIGLNEILHAEGSSSSFSSTSYNNLRLANGDIIEIMGSLQIQFTAK